MADHSYTDGGMYVAPELRKHVAILEREIVELERAGLDRP
jgi:hypothetical protein